MTPSPTLPSPRLPLPDALRLRVARGLEAGEWDGPVATALAWGWGAIAGRAIARPLVWRDGLRVVTVGGATLGGSGKTPLAIACARAVAETGARVALVAHGYRADPGGARVVRVDDDLRRVGDEAIVAARALDGVAAVVVARSRQAALDLASNLAEVVVIDGVLQTIPRRASLALLALDPEFPWGSGAVVPRGDLRAPRSALLAACDVVVALRDDEDGPPQRVSHPPTPSPTRGEGGQLCGATPLSLFGRGAGGEGRGRPGIEGGEARVVSRGAFVHGHLAPWSELASLRLGLFLALARPARLLTRLARRGIAPRRILRLPDHGSSKFPAEAIRTPGIDLWLASPKCALHLEAAEIPHAVLEHSVELEGGLSRFVSYSPT